MSSFLDRWLYDRGAKSHSGTSMLNTNSYNSASSKATQEKVNNYQAAASPGTSPNLMNIPYSYYKQQQLLPEPKLNSNTKFDEINADKPMLAERRGSTSSTSSTSSEEKE
ncbi:hypothetical protein FOA43_001074 [Brettanomyces nanus]|uniref:Uncharacterized protein n=1 Tax=Eeniella nana TaxID=13502 RepID=A0A875RNI0_EENNA|nr:uncharacterized protein FOA43_001074 [Brettanomyces nanus]QPG73760.1 hypothetical protein FOA43_001074 [Brettanomyces nanus]